MMRSLSLFIPMLVLVGSSPAFGEGAIAVGVPAGGPTRGFSWGAYYEAESSSLAEERAIEICKGDNTHKGSGPGHIPAATPAPEAQSRCKIVATFHDQCMAMAKNGSATVPSTAYGWAVASTSEVAMAQALAKCEGMRGKRDAPCQVGFGKAFCDGSAK